MYQKDFIVSNNDVDYRFLLKVSSIYRFFQDVALLATQDLGVDSISLSKHNIDWVITRMDVEINRLPKCNEKITYIMDENKNVIIRASSIWALINAKDRKVVVDRDVIEKLPPETSPYELPLPGKILAKQDKVLIEKRKIHFSDLDFNCHMNNVRYVELLMDVHDFDFYKNHRPSFISLNYIKEIKEQETVTIYSDKNNPEIIEVQVNDTTCFLGKIVFEKQ